jgi:hypothetical protein
MRNDLGIDPVLAHPTSDELGVLGTEVDDENGAARGHRHSVVRTTNWWFGPLAWNDGRVKLLRRVLLIVIALLAIAGGLAPASASVPPDTSPPSPITTDPITTDPITTDPITTDPITTDTVNDFMDLERDVTECISSNPLPGCGREPTSPGDRGGWQQLLLFGVMLGGMAIIFVRVYFSVRSRDRGASNE